MMANPQTPLVIYLDAGQSRRSGGHLARSLRDAWAGPTTILATGASRNPMESQGGGAVCLRISKASLVRDTISLDFGVPANENMGAVHLGASPTAWEGSDSWEPWCGLHPAVAPRPMRGNAREELPWVLLDSESSVPDQFLTGEWQIHRLGEGARPGGAGEVQWQATPSVVAWLIGRVQAVAGRSGPLLFDALRSGVPTVFARDDSGWQALDRLTVHESECAPALAHSLSPAMARTEICRLEILARIEQVRRGAKNVDALMSRDVVLRVRENLPRTRLECHPRFSRFMRKLRKLTRDPEAFLSDSNYPLLHFAGRALAYRTSRSSRGLAGDWVK